MFGDVSFNESLDVSGHLDVFGDVSFNESLDVSGHLDVSGDVSFNKSLDVTGHLDVFGDVSFNESLDVSGHLDVFGDVSFNKSLDVIHDISAGGNLTIHGNSSLLGNILLGSSNETNTITFDGSVNSHIIPNIDASFNLGSSIFGFDNIHLGSGGSIDFSNSDVSFVHIPGEGLRLNGTRQIQFGDANNYMGKSSDDKLQLGSGNQSYIIPSSVTNNYFLKTDDSGVLSWAKPAGGTSASVSVSSAGGTSNYYPIFTSGTGDANLFIDSEDNLKYNPNTNTLTSTKFVGDVTGNASSATDASNVTITTANDQDSQKYYLSFVSGTSGQFAHNVGADLSYNPSTRTLFSKNFQGDVTGNASSATDASKVTITTADNSQKYYLSFVSGNSGEFAHNVGADLSYNPSTKTLFSKNFQGDVTGHVTGDLSGNADSATDASKVTITTANSGQKYYLSFVSGNSGEQAHNVGADLSYNPIEKTLFSKKFQGHVTGDLSGNADTATDASKVTITTADDTVNQKYYLSFVSGKSGEQAHNVGADLSYNPIEKTLFSKKFQGHVTGDLSGNADTATDASKVTITTADDSQNYYLSFVSGTSGEQAHNIGTDLSYNPSSKTLYSTNFHGNISQSSTLELVANNILLHANNTGAGINDEGLIDLTGNILGRGGYFRENTHYQVNSDITHNISVAQMITGFTHICTATGAVTLNIPSVSAMQDFTDISWNTGTMLPISYAVETADKNPDTLTINAQDTNTTFYLNGIATSGTVQLDTIGCYMLQYIISGANTATVIITSSTSNNTST